MRLTSIEFTGYKRLRKAKCNVDGRAIAFIGPNEAGKSTVLQGLEWLTTENSGPLPVAIQNRSAPPAGNDRVVVAVFRLDKVDQDAILAMDLDSKADLAKEPITEFRISKRVDGTQIFNLVPTIWRNPKPFEAAVSAAIRLKTAIDGLAGFYSEAQLTSVPDTINGLISNLNPEDDGWPEARLAELATHHDALELLLSAIPPADSMSRKHARARLSLETAIAHIETARAAAATIDPHVQARTYLAARAPKFVLFRNEVRSLDERYNLSDETVRSNVPLPLQDLLTAAGTSASEIWARVEQGSMTHLRTLERQINEAILARIAPMWTQAKISIAITINQGGLIEINIVELDSPDLTTTPITERSDGLRTFLAMVCFLAAQNLDHPPVLMVDEAERNLHYDAQADLVRVLTSDLDVSKVIYTTHSPGCLPLDLGMGIRVVERDTSDTSASQLSNNFWTDDQPGFSRLLFAMGAEVASFSAFRRAVLAEGVSEMMLLPTLLRNATGHREVDFQVAFGLSNMSAAKALGSVALITTFLVDGDDAGSRKAKQLREEGVPATHIHQLPKDTAIEDLIDQAQYLDTVDGLLLETHKQRIDRKALQHDVNIARAVDLYCLSAPDIGSKVGHKIVAHRLAELGRELKLSSLGKRELPKLRTAIERSLEVSYELDASSN